MNDNVAAPGTGDLGESLAAYLAGNGFADPRVSGLRRLTGGSTHDTWSFDLDHGAGGARQTAPLILRRNLVMESLDMSPQAEFSLLSWLHDARLAVARPLLCEPDGGPLSTPFVIAERIIGTDLRKALAKGGTGRDRQIVGHELAALQAGIHALDVSGCPEGIFEFADIAGSIDIAREVKRWTSPLLAVDGVAHPVMRAAIGWLEAHIPAAGRPCIVHGDFKANNILWSEAGRPVILDWELAHIGDPVEDLAWTMLWTTSDDIVRGLLSPEGYVAAYEKAAGAPVDRDRLFFWQLYALVKLCGILRSGSGTVRDESDLGPSHALLSRGAGYLEAAMADYLVAIAGGKAA